MNGSNQVTGNRAESQAADHLCRHGLNLVERNYRCRGGEIDLIMRDGDTLVFTEVRFRRSDRFGSALQSVDARKQRRLISAAQHYLQANDVQAPCRFDVVGVSGDGRLDWIRNAFGI